MPLIAGGGIGAVVIAIVVLLLGGDPRDVLESGPAPEQTGAPGQQDPGSEFVRGVLYETEETWKSVFQQQLHREYEEPKLVLFSGTFPSACGVGQSAAGPFYCPLDRKVYIDLSFYRDLKDRFGAPGDVAQAYVIAHEVGHHIQVLLGISEQVVTARQRADRAEANALSVRQELQADCLAGVWAGQSQKQRQIFEPGDVEEALTAASAIGDDRMQKRTRGYVVPESFTHGSSAQRVRWFRRGLESGEVRQCDTFASPEL